MNCISTKGRAAFAVSVMRLMLAAGCVTSEHYPWSGGHRRSWEDRKGWVDHPLIFAGPGTNCALLKESEFELGHPYITWIGRVADPQPQPTNNAGSGASSSPPDRYTAGQTPMADTVPSPGTGGNYDWITAYRHNGWLRLAPGRYVFCMTFSSYTYKPRFDRTTPIIELQAGKRYTTDARAIYRDNKAWPRDWQVSIAEAP